MKRQVKDFALQSAPGQSKPIWYFVEVGLAVAATIAIVSIPEGVYPFAYLRLFLSLPFVFFLPGSALVDVLFQKAATIERNEETDIVEWIGFSIVLSLALSALVGLFLNYSPWGISETSISLGLLSVTLTLATISLLRKKF